jgi:DNA repair protein RecN (Recombination protein N)
MLLKPENHYIYLDLVAENSAEREAYSKAFGDFTKIRRQIKELETDADKKYDRIDLLKFQIDELQTADIKVGELEKLRKTRELFQNSEKILKLVDECLYLLCGDADSDGANAMVRSAGLFVEKTGAKTTTAPRRKTVKTRRRF